jgi:segregation and condensation protein A
MFDPVTGGPRATDAPSGTLAAMPYEVSTPVFEGPFDLLLHLILKQEVDLWEVSLTTIVDAYLEELERMEQLDLDVATEFLLIAATLVELKALRLLPSLEDVELDEELLHFEERDLLLARLLECKTFKDAARALDGLIRQADRSVSRGAGPEEPFRSLAPDPLESVAPSVLMAALTRVLIPRPTPHVDTDHVAPIRASVRDAVDALLAVLPATEPIAFRELVAGQRERLEVIVRFLAVLELYKQGRVEIDQAGTFAELLITWTGDGDSAPVTSDTTTGVEFSRHA